MSSYRILSSIGTKTDFCLLCALLRFVRFFLLSPFRRGANSSRVAYVLDCSETRFAIGQTHTHTQRQHLTSIAPLQQLPLRQCSQAKSVRACVCVCRSACVSMCVLVAPSRHSLHFQGRQLCSYSNFATLRCRSSLTLSSACALTRSARVAATSFLQNSLSVRPFLKALTTCDYSRYCNLLPGNLSLLPPPASPLPAHYKRRQKINGNFYECRKKAEIKAKI